MKQDPIVAEVRRVRERLAARFNHNITAIAAHYQKLDREAGSQCVQRPPRLLIAKSSKPAKL